MNCRNCGDPVDPRRVDLGYDYCTTEECQRVCVDRVRMARVTVNKAADQFERVERVAVPIPSASGYSADERAETAPAAARAAKAPAKHRIPSALERLQAAAADLDGQLRRSDERFCAGEITAREMKREQNAAIGAFNSLVRAENIRYRGLLRKPA